MPLAPSFSSKSPVTTSPDWRLPVEKPTYSWNQIVTLCLKERLKDLCKLCNYGGYYAGLAFKEVATDIRVFSLDMGHFKNGIALLEVYTKGPDIFFKSNSVRELAVNVGSCFSSAVDGLSFLSRYCTPVSASTLSFLSKANIWAVLGVCGNYLVEDSKKLIELGNNEKSTDAQLGLTLLKIAMDVSYVAFASLSLICSAMGTTLSLPVLITCLTSATVFGLIAFVYEKVADPFFKNIDANFEALVRENPKEPASSLRGRIQFAAA